MKYLAPIKGELHYIHLCRDPKSILQAGVDSQPDADRFVVVLVEISGPSDQHWSNVVKETTRGGGVSKRPLSAAVRLKLPSFNIHAQSDGYFSKSTKLILILSIIVM